MGHRERAAGLTGVRIEELTEITHHSLIQYRLPTTGEIVPLLQIAPSKTNTERLLVVSPELADVLSAIIVRVRDDTGAVPLVPAYDWHECLWRPPAPALFQRTFGTENRAISHGTIRKMIQAALADTSLTDPVDGGPLNYTPHDFCRLFITDAILNGLPPHIAQVIAGHRDINVTLGYKAVYPEEAIQAHLAFLARRRSLPERGISRPHRRGMGRVPRALRAPQGLHRTLRPRLPHPASTSTPACDARCTGQIRLNGNESWRSTTTSSPGSPKPNAKDGSAKSKDSRSAWPAPTTNSPDRPTRPRWNRSRWECPAADNPRRQHARQAAKQGAENTATTLSSASPGSTGPMRRVGWKVRSAGSVAAI